MANEVSNRHQRAGIAGGSATYERYGDQFAAWGRKGGQNTKEKLGLEHYRELGRRSAQKRLGKPQE